MFSIRVVRGFIGLIVVGGDCVNLRSIRRSFRPFQHTLELAVEEFAVHRGPDRFDECVVGAGFNAPR